MSARNRERIGRIGWQRVELALEGARQNARLGTQDAQTWLDEHPDAESGARNIFQGIVDEGAEVEDAFNAVLKFLRIRARLDGHAL